MPFSVWLLFISRRSLNQDFPNCTKVGRYITILIYDMRKTSQNNCNMKMKGVAI